MALIASMAALVLSLLIASANGTYQAQRNELQSLSADMLTLDRLLGFYGAEASGTRDGLQVRLKRCTIGSGRLRADGARISILPPRNVANDFVAHC